MNGESQNLANFDYQTEINKEEQFIDFIFDFKEKVTDDTLEFNFNQDPNNPNFDEDGNLIYKN